MEDSNPQETIADLYVGFLDRCATITPIFHFLLPIFTARIPGAVVPAHPPWPIRGDQPVKLSKPGRWHRRQDLNLRTLRPPDFESGAIDQLCHVHTTPDRGFEPLGLTPCDFQDRCHQPLGQSGKLPCSAFTRGCNRPCLHCGTRRSGCIQGAFHHCQNNDWLL